MKNLIASILCLTSAVSFAAAQSAPSLDTKWTPTGFGGAGYYWSCAFDPKNPNVLYLGGDVDGLWKSSDAGRSWKFANRGLHNYGVYGLAVAPSDGRVVYAMTEDGIARSTDSATTWKPLSSSLQKGGLALSANRHASVHPLAVDPVSAMTVYAGSGKGRLCKSVDGGETWTELDYRAALPPAPKGPDAFSGAGFLWLQFPHPASCGRAELIYANKPRDFSGATRLVARFRAPDGAPDGLKASIAIQTGSGWTWRESPLVALVPGSWTEVSFDLSKVSDLATVRMVHLVVRAMGAPFSGDIGVDAVEALPTGGKLGLWDVPGSVENWRASRAADAPGIASIRPSLGGSSDATAPIGAIVVAPSDSRRLYLAQTRLGVFTSTDAGATWRYCASAPSSAASLSVAARDSRLVYGAFGKAGIWRSTDGGATWTKCGQGISGNTEARDLSVDPRNSNHVVGIMRQNWNGIMIATEDGGATWKSSRSYRRDIAGAPASPNGGAATADLSSPANIARSPANPDVLYIAANWANVLSVDAGRTWVERDAGADILCFYDLRFGSENIYACAMDAGLYASANNGGSWRQLVPDHYIEGTSGHFWRLGLVPLAGGVERIVTSITPWAGAHEFPNKVLVSDDGGKIFMTAKGLPAYLPHQNTLWGTSYARALAIDPVRPTTLYLGMDGDAEGAGKEGGGLFRSTDGGLSWMRLPSQPGSRRFFFGLAVDPTDSKRLFCATQGYKGGVWRSEDAGTSWAHLSGPDEWLYNLEIAPDGTVYAAGNELWQSRDHGARWRRLPLPHGEGTSIVGLAIDPENSDRLWASAVSWSGSAIGGIWQSADGGTTWTSILGDLPYVKPMVLRYNTKRHELWAVGVGLFKTKVGAVPSLKSKNP